MTKQTDDTEKANEENSWVPESTRRRVLKLGGASAAAATLGGAGMVAGQQDDDGQGGDGDDGDGQGGDGGSESVFDDLVDPTFGYPLAAEESGGVSFDHVVDVTQEDGEGAHPDFPSEPDGEAPGSFVEIPAEFYFDPVGLRVSPGDLVHFRVLNGLHTVTAFTELADPNLEVPRRVPEGVPPFTAPPLTAGQSWVYEFSDPGVYDYLCLPHLGLGMVARIVVIGEDDDVSDDQFSVPEPENLFPNDARVLSAEELDPANIVEQGTVAWEDLTLGEPTATATGIETETETGDGEDGAVQGETATETPTESGTESGGG